MNTLANAFDVALSQSEKLELAAILGGGVENDMDCDNPPVVEIVSRAAFPLSRAALNGGKGLILSHHRPICQDTDTPDGEEDLPEAVRLRAGRMGESPLPGYVLPSMRTRGDIIREMRAMGCSWHD